jgi:hypothetical protein
MSGFYRSLWRNANSAPKILSRKIRNEGKQSRRTEQLSAPVSTTNVRRTPSLSYSARPSRLIRAIRLPRGCNQKPISTKFFVQEVRYGVACGWLNALNCIRTRGWGHSARPRPAHPNPCEKDIRENLAFPPVLTGNHGRRAGGRQGGGSTCRLFTPSLRSRARTLHPSAVARARPRSFGGASRRGRPACGATQRAARW